MAEVLITLIIVGIIAAITVPVMVNNYKNKILVENFKTAYSLLNQGMKKAMADTGVTNFTDTDLFSECADYGYAYDDNAWRDKCAPALEKVFKNMRSLSVPDMKAEGDTTNIITNTQTCKELVGKTNKWWYLNDHTKCRGWKNIAFELANAMRIDMGLYDGGYHAGTITVDVNGGKGPNTWGRDAFYLVVLKDGRIVPIYSREYANAVAEYYNNDTYKKTQYYSTMGDYCSPTTTQEGVACAARIIESGWVMDY